MDYVKSENLKCTIFIQPALIVGERKVPRSDEIAMYKCFKWINPVVELLIRKPMYNPAEDIADCMLFAANFGTTPNPVSYYDSGSIKRTAKLAR